MRLIALRHGQSAFNRLGLCNDDPARRVDLSETGVRQARAAGIRLAGEPIERVFCSPLLRARRTAEIVVARRGLEVAVDERLADIRSGFDGRPVSEYFAAIAADPVDTRPDRGESLRDYDVRVSGFLEWLGEQPWQCVLVVAHEETLRLIRAYCEGLQLHVVVGQAFGNAQPCLFDLPGRRGS